ncbi:MAG: hypothetical protein LBJ00_12755 [Planctomycetaceae bacterium]|jgi:hypothetical protein|nr:hypothetical protein [Planctomycetaceae bacterium]
MSILSLRGYTAGVSSANYCPSCGRTSSTVANIGQSYANSSGRAGNGDSYVCETCRSGSQSQTSRSTYSATSPSASGICPLCGQKAGVNDPHWSNNNGRAVTTQKTSSNNTAAKSSTVSSRNDAFR